MRHVPPIAALCLLAVAGTVHAQVCADEWSEAFTNGDFFPVDHVAVFALAEIDRGDGPVLVAAGGFDHVAGVEADDVATWDGTTWSALGEGFQGFVTSLAMFDDGSGPALHAGGHFPTTVSGAPIGSVARWDGEAWQALGSGVAGPLGLIGFTPVHALAVYDDGTGPGLYAGGGLVEAGGAPANRIARWDGARWSPLDAGIAGPFPRVYAMSVHETPDGPVLVVGGSFTTAGETPALNVAAWDGRSWSAFGPGMPGDVRALVTYDDGAGPAPYAGITETGSGAPPAGGLYRWDGMQWSLVGGGVASPSVTDLEVHAGALMVGGNFSTVGEGEDALAAHRVARWDARTWAALGEGIDYPPGLPVVYEHLPSWGRADVDRDGVPELFAGGTFDRAGEMRANGIARWHDGDWSPLTPVAGVDRDVSTLALHRGDDGPELFAGGYAFGVDPTRDGPVARWDGAAWRPIVLGRGYARDLAWVPDGAGIVPGLYAAGGLRLPDETLAAVARWDGRDEWIPEDANLGPSGSALALHDDGHGPRLYAAGFRERDDDTFEAVVSRRDDEGWTPLPGTIDESSPETSATVRCLLSADGPEGHGLYIAGTFSHLDGVAAPGVARWDGARWHAVTSGDGSIDGPVSSITVLDTADGPLLVAGGNFTAIDGVAAAGVAAWNGEAWSPIGGGLDGYVRDVTVLERVGPDLLVAAGRFESLVPDTLIGVASWDGIAWRALATVEQPWIGDSSTHAHSLLAVPAADGATDLLVGGRFEQCAGVVSKNIARHAVCAPVRLGDLDGDDRIDASDLALLLGARGPCATCPADLDDNGAVGFADLTWMLAHWTG